MLVLHVSHEVFPSACLVLRVELRRRTTRTLQVALSNTIASALLHAQSPTHANVAKPFTALIYCDTTLDAVAKFHPPGNAWNLSAIEMIGEVISTEHRAWHNTEGHRVFPGHAGSSSNSSDDDPTGDRRNVASNGKSRGKRGWQGQTTAHIGVSVWGPTLNVNRDPRWGEWHRE